MTEREKTERLVVLTDILKVLSPNFQPESKLKAVILESIHHLLTYDTVGN